MTQRCSSRSFGARVGLWSRVAQASPFTATILWSSYRNNLSQRRREDQGHLVQLQVTKAHMEKLCVWQTWDPLYTGFCACSLRCMFGDDPSISGISYQRGTVTQEDIELGMRSDDDSTTKGVALSAAGCDGPLHDIGLKL